ncbi:ParA family protein [Cellulosimicrobium sp. AB352]|uniref:ParA family protein n=1 Tax=Cellulosimicrobium sp. AB352 TaxID=3413281 RepID=UPI003C2169E4
MKTVAFFNNKGGVGKTTLACNAAAFMARLGQRVVLIDCDPQANSTQLLLQDETWGALYEDRRRAENETVIKALRHIRSGDSGIESNVTLIDSPRFGVRVLAGHPSLSTLEDQLSQSWGEFGSGVLGGARRSLWARKLTDTIDADVIIFDLGPSLGALNRSVLIGADYFVTPVAADLFSLYALENIAEWMRDWVSEYKESWQKLNKKDPDGVRDWVIPEGVPITSGYAGYTVQQYVTRNTRGQGRGVAAYERYRRQIPERASGLQEFGVGSDGSLELGVVPNMFSMIPLAQFAHAPISHLTTSDGVRGAQVSQQARYTLQLDRIFSRLAKNVGVTEPGISGVLNV